MLTVHLKMSSLARKNEKKLRKHQHIVSKQTGVICSSTPTKNIALCNVGLVNGMSEETIVAHFLIHGPMTRIVLLPEKSCSFIQYETLESAIAAYNTNGLVRIAQDNKPVYLCFVDSLPEVHDSKLYNVLPPGLILLKDFISEEEENRLLLLEEELITSPKQNMKNRQVKHYGYEFRYDTNNIDKQAVLDPVPETYHYIFKRLQSSCGLFDIIPDQLTINHYLPGQGIPHHIDTHSAFTDPIISLSLGSSVVMEFKNDDNRHLCVLLPQRSMLIMSGESRYNWSHGIVPRKFDVVNDDNGYNILERRSRVSFTFRKIRTTRCNCTYKSKCDSYLSQLFQTNIDKCLASEVEKKHVHDVYEDIADHFSDTRHTRWPKVTDFVKTLESGSILMDIGCGNGKYLGSNVGTYNIGCDMSSKLNQVCKTRGYETFVCNCLSIPVKDSSVDAVLSIAVIHHIANKGRRLQAVTEIVRILKDSGQALIYVWAKNQFKDGQNSNYIKEKCNNDHLANKTGTEQSVRVTNDVVLPVHANRSNFLHADLLVPWKCKRTFPDHQTEDTFLRYYHVFEEGELVSLCKLIDNVEIIDTYYDEGNWCVRIKKCK